MPNNWKTYTLDEICNRITDGSHSSPKEVKNGNYQIATVKDMNDYGLYLHQCKRISDIDFESLKNQDCVPEKGDVLFSKDGTIGKVLLFDFDYKIGVLSSIAIFRPKKELIDSMFLSYYLKEQTNNNFIKDNFRSGSAIPRIILRDFKKYNLTVPELPEQQSIAAILSAIDDKIENNLAINKTLEEMAMALYKHWFVDFGPFQDGEFVESELGRIPRGWEVKRLDDLIDVLSKGTTPRMKDVEGLDRKIPFLKVKDINSDGEININGLELIPEEIHLKDLKRSILLENDLLFSIAGTIGRVSIVTETLNNSNCNQALAFIRLKEKEIYKAIVYYWLKSDEVQNRIQNSVVQGVQANVSLTVLKELVFIKPSDNVLNEFSIKVNPIFELVLKNQKENQTLTQLRDSLLPKLISGEVRLKEFRE